MKTKPVCWNHYRTTKAVYSKPWLDKHTRKMPKTKQMRHTTISSNLPGIKQNKSSLPGCTTHLTLMLARIHHSLVAGSYAKLPRTFDRLLDSGIYLVRWKKSQVAKELTIPAQNPTALFHSYHFCPCSDHAWHKYIHK